MANAVILGAGRTGVSLAQLLAQAGYCVVLCAPGQPGGERMVPPLQQVQRGLERLARAGRLQEAVETCAARVTFEIDPGSILSSADLVLDLLPSSDRPAFWQMHGRHLTPEALVALQSSTEPLAPVANLLPNPHRVLGMLWFTPAELHPLVEITSTAATCPEYVRTAHRLARELGKEPVQSLDGPGRVAVRLLAALVLEAGRLVDEGIAGPADIDRACRLALGATTGPLAWTDQHGLAPIADLLTASADVRGLPDSLRERLAAGGAAGRGFYES